MLRDMTYMQVKKIDLKLVLCFIGSELSNFVKHKRFASLSESEPLKLETWPDYKNYKNVVNFCKLHYDWLKTLEHKA